MPGSALLPGVVDDLLAIDRDRHRLTDGRIRPEVVGLHTVNLDVHRLVGTDRAGNQARSGCLDLVGRLAWHIGDHVDIAGLQREQASGWIGVELERDFADAGRLAPVVGIGCDGVIAWDVLDL